MIFTWSIIVQHKSSQNHHKISMAIDVYCVNKWKLPNLEHVISERGTVILEECTLYTALESLQHTGDTAINSLAVDTTTKAPTHTCQRRNDHLNGQIGEH